MNRSLIALMLTLLLAACKPDDPLPPTAGAGYPGGTLVLCEGTYTWGNASLSWISADGMRVENDIYTRTNDLPLGDVLQSAVMAEGSLWLVVNHSGKIVNVNPLDMTWMGEITGLNSPRYLHPLGNGRAWCTDLYAGGVHILDLRARQRVGFLPARGWTEEVVESGGLLWVAGMGSAQVYAGDPVAGTWVDSVAVDPEPGSLALDAGGRVWVLCGGGYAGVDSAALVCVDPATRAVVRRLGLPPGSMPHSLTYAAGTDALLYLDAAGVHRLELAGTTGPQLVLPDRGGYYYGLEVQPDGTIWLADARDFVSAGRVYRLLPGALTVQDSFTVGVGASGFLWR